MIFFQEKEEAIGSEWLTTTSQTSRDATTAKQIEIDYVGHIYDLGNVIQEVGKLNQDQTCL